MEQSNINYLKGYLGTGLKMYWEDFDGRQKYPWELKGHNIEFAIENQNKPILFNLSSLTKEIEIDGNKFIPQDEIRNNFHFTEFYKPTNYDLEINLTTEDYSQEVDLYVGYLIVQKLYEWHFDIHGLIEKGLAIDVTSLPDNPYK